MSKSSAASEPSTPKPLPSADAPVAKPALPDFVTSIPDGAKVFVLVPENELERRHVDAQFEDACSKYFEVAPTRSHALLAGRLPPNSFLLVAHCIVQRARREDGTFGDTHKICIGGPLALDKFTKQSGDGYTWSTDLGALVDATTGVCTQANGYVWHGLLSGDPTPETKLLRLVKE